MPLGDKKPVEAGPKRTDSLCKQDRKWLLEAIELSKCCPRSPSSYAVGALIVEAQERCIASGYSLEWGDGWHAEAVAIEKALHHREDLGGLCLYASIEPCSKRKSGRRPCTEAIISSGLTRVVYAFKEPPLFVRCQGDAVLRKHGIEVNRLKGLEPLVEAVNHHLLEGHVHSSNPPPRAK